MKRPKTAAERKERVAEILRRLDQMYPDATCALLHRNPWELLVATILSAQCTDKRVNEVTPGLFAKYPTPQRFRRRASGGAGARYPQHRLLQQQGEIDRGRGAAGWSPNSAGRCRKTMEEMLTIPGAARKTANVVLGTAYGIASGVVVDTHVQRISARLDLTKKTDPVKIEQDLMKIIPKERWILFSHQMILHGRALCLARAPLCDRCDLNSVCYAADKRVP